RMEILSMDSAGQNKSFPSNLVKLIVENLHSIYIQIVTLSLSVYGLTESWPVWAGFGECYKSLKDDSSDCSILTLIFLIVFFLAIIAFIFSQWVFWKEYLSKKSLLRVYNGIFAQIEGGAIEDLNQFLEFIGGGKLKFKQTERVSVYKYVQGYKIFQ